jgi:hypothetical protein
MKTYFEPGTKADSIRCKTIYIFSDAMNDHTLSDGGVALQGYKVHVCVASTVGLTAQAWETIRNLWTRYLATARAMRVVYSADE